MNETQYITLKDVARTMSREYRTVWGWAKDGKLPTVKIGGSVYVRQADFDKWIKERSVNG